MHAMNNMLQRLRAGQARLRDQLIFRATGAVCLYGFIDLTARLWALQQSRPTQVESGQGLALALGAVMCLFAGLALLLGGPDLLRDVDYPQPRHRR